jgi:hypothetical protein
LCVAGCGKNLKVVLLAILVLTCSAIAVSGQVGTVTSHTMAKSVDPSTERPVLPNVDPSTGIPVFLTTDDAAHSWFEIRTDTFGGIMFRWKWYEPQGTLYKDTGDTVVKMVEKGKAYTLWDTLPIKGTPVESRLGKWRVEVFAKADLLFNETFTLMTPQTTYKIKVSATGFESRFYTAVYVDGASKGTISGGSSVEFTFNLGTSHSISVDSIVRGDQGARFVCSAPSWTVSAESSHDFVYNTEYFLSVSSQYGTPTGEGWYREGTIAKFSVNTPVAGPIGVQYVFKQWSGDSTSREPQSTLVMSGPRQVTAVWDTDYSLFSLILTVILGAAAILVVVTIIVSRRRVPKARGPTLPRPGPPVPVCRTCGKPTMYVSRARRYYCTQCKKYVS